jgi:hypothetical protein
MQLSLSDPEIMHSFLLLGPLLDRMPAWYSVVMVKSIPTSLGLLTLSVLATGCGDAHKVASAFKKVCKAECECSETMDDWDDLDNCKDACRGYAILLEARIDDNVDSEPCSDLDKIVGDLKRCAKNSCGLSRDQCVLAAYNELRDCWDITDVSYYPFYDGPSSSEIAQQLMTPIPGALDPDTLHSASDSQ